MGSVPSVFRTALAVGPPRVVCVDLDGTLVIGDLLWESFVALVKRRPIRALRALWSLRRGKAHFKRAIAQEVPIDPAALLYRADLLDHLHELHRQGARLVLATASDESYGRAVAEHLGIFENVVASDGRTNLSGRHKAAALVTRYGVGRFEYIGNGWVDVPVWRSASAGIAVAAPSRLLRYGKTERFISEVRGEQRRRLTAVAGALRPHQWIKNLLVFVPVAAAHTILRLDLLWLSIVTFVVFSVSASGIYILNDMSDILSDRQHPRKRARPFAAGDLSIPFGVVLATVLLGIAIILAVTLVSWQLALVLGIYVIVTSGYSLQLKRQPVVDVFTLTSLYILRIVAGGVSTGTPLSSWLLAFALFFFLSLAFVKRYTELLITDGWIAGRGYCRDDALWMHAVGTSAGYMAVLVLALYVSAPETSALYARPPVLWLLCPLALFWLTRLWFRAGRGLVHDDPVLDAMRDSASYAIGVAAVGIMLAAA
jgi:4-hydroxybenzoate polyprenyltransferase/phosphoserine phosphatase